MASNKPQISIPVPHTGVRKDKQEMLRDGTMAAKGDNCIFFDGSIRPRPALTKELGTVDVDDWVGDGDGADLPPEIPEDDIQPPPLVPTWQQVYDGLADDYSLNHIVNINGILLGVNADTHEWQMSVDGGENWTEPAFTFPAGKGGFDVWWMEYYPATDRLWMAFTNDVWWAELGSFPTSIGAWTEVDFDGITSYSPFGPGRNNFKYDSDSDTILYIGAKSRVNNALWIGDASGTPTANLMAGYDAGQITGVRIDDGSFVTLNDGTKWWVWAHRETDQIAGTDYSHWTKIKAESLVWTTTWTIATTEYEHVLISNDNSGDSDKPQTYNPHGWDIDRQNGTLYTPILGQCSFDAGTVDEVVFVCSPRAAEASRDHEIQSVTLSSSSGFGADEIVREHLSFGGNYEPVYAYARTDKVMLFGMEVGDYALPEMYCSTDNGNTWMHFLYGQSLTVTMDGYTINANEDQDQYIVTGAVDGATYTVAWQPAIGSQPVALALLAGTALASPQGEVTTAFQLDLDDEDNAIIAGTTKQIAKLDRTNGVWTRLTANSGETAGTDPWTDTDDVPPLSVHDSESEYVNGVTIDGAYGVNPWVFRTVEAQDKTFLIGTNGQCYPICYHSDMAGGLARRMGEVPPGDPNDLPAFDAGSFPTGYLRSGNLAPKARCMAVGANRVILANLPGTSAYGVEVSGFNDTDRGWGLEQFTLLGDTPGSIVTMKEISALSIAMYKTDAIYHAVAQTEFMGVAAPFRFELSKAGIAGPCSPASVLRNFDGRQIYLARDGGVYMYDGVAPIDGGRNIRRMIQGQLDHNNYGKVWGMVDRQRKLIWFFFPAAGTEVNRGLVISTDQGYPWPVWPLRLPDGWNFVTGSDVRLQDDISIGEVGRFGDYTDETLGSFASGEQTMLMGTLNNLWFKQKWGDDGDYTDDGIPILIDFEGGWIAPGGVQIHTADELYHLFKGAGLGYSTNVEGNLESELNIRLKAQQIGASVRYSKWAPLYNNVLRRRTRHRVSGEKFAMQMKGAITRSFNWAGATLTAVKGGRR